MELETTITNLKDAGCTGRKYGRPYSFANQAIPKC